MRNLYDILESILDSDKDIKKKSSKEIKLYNTLKDIVKVIVVDLWKYKVDYNEEISFLTCEKIDSDKVEMFYTDVENIKNIKYSYNGPTNLFIDIAKGSDTTYLEVNYIQRLETFYVQLHTRKDEIRNIFNELIKKESK